MTLAARYVHTNLTGRDWRRLARFYTELFGCTLVPPERDLHGSDLDAATGLDGAHLTGAHLRLPGHGDTGPTLEIFSYDRLREANTTAVDRPGWGHIAFQVDDVRASRAAVVAAGGSTVGHVITSTVADGRRVTWCYTADPEGNIVELQSWQPSDR